MNKNNAATPIHLYGDFPDVWKLDHKIQIFEERVFGWQIDIAQQCTENIPNSGFAVLSILSSYFEMIAKFKEGYVGDAKREKYFNIGIRDFLSNCPNIKCDLKDKLASKFWMGVRGALYHTGITKGVNLDGDYLYSIEFPGTNDKININPGKLVLDIHQHFTFYMQKLKNTNSTLLRKNFEARFDYQRK